MATNIISLISTFIESIRDTNTISSITSTGTTRRINTNDTKRLALNEYVKISGVESGITKLVSDTYFEVVRTASITGTEWTASAPYFYYGTVQMIANTLDKIQDYNNKYPLIVLFETMPAQVDDSPLSSTERTVELEMYFAKDSNYEDWTSDEYYTYCILPLQLYVDAFIEVIKNSSYIARPLKTHKETPYSKWNMTRISTGKNVFNASLSAIGLNISLPIYKQNIDC